MGGETPRVVTGPGTGGKWSSKMEEKVGMLALGFEVVRSFTAALAVASVVGVLYSSLHSLSRKRTIRNAKGR